MPPLLHTSCHQWANPVSRASPTRTHTHMHFFLGLSLLHFSSSLDHSSSSLEKKKFASLGSFGWFANQRYKTHFAINSVSPWDCHYTGLGNAWRDSYMIMLTFKSTTELSKDNLKTLLQWLIRWMFAQKCLMYCSTHQSLSLYSERLFGIYPSPSSSSLLLQSKIQPGEQWDYAKNIECLDSKQYWRADLRHRLREDCTSLLI